MLKGPSPVIEVETKNASSEPVDGSNSASANKDIVTQRQESNFHFFSDTEVTK